jgi:hypothetical protein
MIETPCPIIAIERRGPCFATRTLLLCLIGAALTGFGFYVVHVFKISASVASEAVQPQTTTAEPHTDFYGLED